MRSDQAATSVAEKLFKDIPQGNMANHNMNLSDRDEQFQSGTNYSRLGEAMRQAILTGEFWPGMRLKVQDLATRYAVSINPVREALQQLQGEGLIEIIPNRGASVRVITRKLIEDLADIREAMDGILAARATPLIRPEHLEHLRHLNGDLTVARSHGENAQTAKMSSDFHEYIGEIAGNEQALRLRRNHFDIFRLIRTRYGFVPGRAADVAREHEEIIRALESGDSRRAEEAARHHAWKSREDMLARFAEEEG